MFLSCMCRGRRGRVCPLADPGGCACEVLLAKLQILQFIGKDSGATLIVYSVIKIVNVVFQKWYKYHNTLTLIQWSNNEATTFIINLYLYGIRLPISFLQKGLCDLDHFYFLITITSILLNTLCKASTNFFFGLKLYYQRLSQFICA